MKLLLSILIVAAYTICGTAQSENWRNRFYFFTEFMNGYDAGVSGKDLFASISGSGATCNSPQGTTDSKIIGINRMSTGTATTGRAYIGTPLQQILLGGGSWRYEIRILGISALCQAAQGYVLAVGFLDAVSANQTDGVYFLYDSLGVSTSSASSDRWQTVTSAAGSRTFTETTVDVSTGAVTLAIEVNSDATSIDYFIDNVLVRTETATIPATAGTNLGFGILLLKNAGATAVTVDLDYLEVIGRYTIQR